MRTARKPCSPVSIQLNAQFEKKSILQTGVSAVSPYPTEWKYAY